ncbi:hypothetical protein N7481_002485 [Penicillium waksmanii]|uniref:uncharacterized protein n=1 Tax=Penicillium waksmanii TaxID=69791 RepID=UPI0025470CC9|nr:uncharacterized protein N7481_002485 [Penicillium waksmanii]KAJ5995508.1 hypothetical protein N7481_002485 [Penicillium waksmanii]
MARIRPRSLSREIAGMAARAISEKPGSRLGVAEEFVPIPIALYDENVDPALGVFQPMLKGRARNFHIDSTGVQRRGGRVILRALAENTFVEIMGEARLARSIRDCVCMASDSREGEGTDWHERLGGVSASLGRDLLEGTLGRCRSKGRDIDLMDDGIKISQRIEVIHETEVEIHAEVEL